MQWTITGIVARNFWHSSITTKTFYFLYLIFILLTAYAAVGSIQNQQAQNDIQKAHQTMARESWEANPDKHPHRMGHFGTFAFRVRPPLALFDPGLESFMGNTIFLEAHRQNSVNFSEATFSTGTLRFGALSLALLLQLVLPLILFFIGFSSVATDKQNGTLKIVLLQVGSWRSLLFGKSVGLFGISLLFAIPVFLMVGIALLVIGDPVANDFRWLRFLLMGSVYLSFFLVISVITIVVSTMSSSPKNALLSLLGVWLVLVILLPKSIQAVGSYWYPTPSKLAFESAIEKEIIKKGDSHNPDDPYYHKLRDSVLTTHGVQEVTDLPFNYSGFVMREGEKTSSTIFNKHQSRLIALYKNQNRTATVLSFLNPFMAVKQLSMTIAGTDFLAYQDFQNQADLYRYDLAQTMNELQMAYISPKKKSGSEGKKHVVDREHWSAYQDFKHQPTAFTKAIIETLPGLIAIVFWVLLAFGLLVATSKKAKAL